MNVYTKAVGSDTPTIRSGWPPTIDWSMPQIAVDVKVCTAMIAPSEIPGKFLSATKGTNSSEKQRLSETALVNQLNVHTQRGRSPTQHRSIQYLHMIPFYSHPIKVARTHHAIAHAPIIRSLQKLQEYTRTLNMQSEEGLYTHLYPCRAVLQMQSQEVPRQKIYRPLQQESCDQTYQQNRQHTIKNVSCFIGL